MFYTVFILLLIAVIFLVLYYVIYTRRINQRVRGENIKGKRMPDFPKVIMAAVIVFLLSICIINTLNPPVTAVSSRNNYAIIDTSDYRYLGYSSETTLDDASFAKAFSKDKNEGYDRREIQDGDFRFIVFTTKTPSDAFHPDFLCYVIYTGDTTDAISCNGQFIESATGHRGGTASIWDYTNHTLLVVGNCDKECKFNLTMGSYHQAGYENYLNSDDPEQEMESFAESTGSVLVDGDGF